MTPPVACMRRDHRAAMMTEWESSLTVCFVLPADMREEVDEEDRGGKGDREEVGHLTPLTNSGR